jgi:dTDP-4-dehydrorhamnose reductase
MKQYASKKIQRALATGHLVLVANQVISAISENDLKKMIKKIKAQYKQGMELAKVQKGYNFEQAKALAKAFEIEADPEDTVETLIEAVFKELANSEE